MPAVSAQQLLARLAKGKPVPGILLLGSEAICVSCAARNSSMPMWPEGVRDWGVTRFSAEDDDLSAILGQAQTCRCSPPSK